MVVGPSPAATVGAYAGSGRESLTDGALGAAALAQPSGITTDGSKTIFRRQRDQFHPLRRLGTFRLRPHAS